ncbi:MAG TPA: hypothetical protein VGE97_00785 [Nitrososphaera sp.]|jgi:hypothetical protein
MDISYDQTKKWWDYLRPLNLYDRSVTENEVIALVALLQEHYCWSNDASSPLSSVQYKRLTPETDPARSGKQFLVEATVPWNPNNPYVYRFSERKTDR